MPIAIFNIPVPPSGLGPMVDISALLDMKTVIFTGTFTGSFTLLVSHDGTHWAPAAFFDSNGRESIVVTMSEAYRFAAVQSNGFSSANNLLQISGVSRPGENHFAQLAALVPGNMGPQPSIDTWAVFPPTGLEESANVICEGSFDGYVVVEGSQDNVHFNSLGNFQALQSSADLQFKSLAVPPFVRYLRVFVKGTVLAPTVVTIGGQVPSDNDQAAGVLDLSDDDPRVFTRITDPEGIIYEYEVNLSKLLVGALISVSLTGIARASAAATATFKVYLGATTPGDTTGGTIVASTNTASNTDVAISAQGGSFANPGGLALVQVTGAVINVEDSAFLRGISIVIG